MPLGVAAWYATYRAGVHPTIAAVALGLLTPAAPVAGREVLIDLEHRLHPWSSYLVVPVFALANAGIPLGGGVLGEAATSRLTWAVLIGLVVGKSVGISGAAALVVRARIGKLPTGVGNGHLAGAAALGGIGFTVSLFVSGLAFESVALQGEAKIGILVGSLLAAALGSAVLIAQTRLPP